MVGVTEMVGVTDLVAEGVAAAEAVGVGGKRKRSKSLVIFFVLGGVPSWVVQPVGRVRVASTSLASTSLAASVSVARAMAKTRTTKRPKLNLLFWVSPLQRPAAAKETRAMTGEKAEASETEGLGVGLGFEELLFGGLGVGVLGLTGITLRVISTSAPLSLILMTESSVCPSTSTVRSGLTTAPFWMKRV